MRELLNIGGEVVDVTNMSNAEILAKRGFPSREEAIELMYRQAVKLIDDTLVYGKMNTPSGFKSYNVKRSIEIWLKNKMQIIEKMERQQNYNGHFQCIIENTPYVDAMHDEDIDGELHCIADMAKEVFPFEEYVYENEGNIFNGAKYSEIKEKYVAYNKIHLNLTSLSDETYFTDDICEITKRYKKMYDDVLEAYKSADNNAVVERGRYITRESRSKYLEFRRAIYKLKTTTIDDVDFISFLNRTYGMRFVVGLKSGKILDRLINKVCPDAKNCPNWNSHRAKLGDLLNPMSANGKTVYSVNYCDYLTSSMGRKWRSCHNLDKKLFLWRDNGDYADGCCSSGIFSYACDVPTLVTYLLKNDNNKTFWGEVAKESELAFIPKDMRNLLHVNVADKYYVQGRIYPQGNDDYSAIYKQFNENHKKFFSSLVGIDASNIVTSNGCDACTTVLEATLGSQNYKDWENFDSCNVNYLKGVLIDELPRIYVGYKHMALDNFNKVALGDYVLSNKICYNSVLKAKRDAGEYRILDVADDEFWKSIEDAEKNAEAERLNFTKNMLSNIKQATITGTDVWVYQCSNGDWLIFEEKDKLIEYMTSHEEEC